MSYHRSVFTAANLLAHLEATSLGWVEASQEEQSRALEAVKEVSQAEGRRRRAHRRPSPGRSRLMRSAGSSAVALFVVALSALLAGGPGCA